MSSSRGQWRSKAVGLIASLAAAPMSPALGAPITFNTALPVAKGELIFRELAVLNRSGDDPSRADRDVTAWAGVSVLGYGVDSRLAVFGALPYVDKELEMTVDGSRRARDSGGIGDLSLFGRYTVYQQDRPGRTLRLAPFAGFKAPTGEHEERDALGELPAPLQAGSGSWDAFGGVVASYQTLDYQIDGQLAYRANTEADDFEAGDEANLDGSLQYRLWPRGLPGGVPAFLYGVIEVNLAFQDEDRVAGRDEPNSGGTRLFVTPGLQYVTRRWVVEAAVQLPVLQDLNGAALETDYVAQAGFRIAF